VGFSGEFWEGADGLGAAGWWVAFGVWECVSIAVRWNTMHASKY